MLMEQKSYFFWCFKDMTFLFFFIQVSYDGAKTNLLRKLVSVQRKVETMKASSTVQNVANMLEYLEKL